MEIGCVASFSDAAVEAQPKTDAEVEQQAEVCDDGESRLAPAPTVTTEDISEAMLQEQQDDKAPAPVPHDQEVSAAPEHAAEVPALPEEHHGDVDEKDQVAPEAAAAAVVDEEEGTRERLKRHRREMAGTVWIPEMWGQEKLLKDWVDCAVFDRPMVPTGLLTARRALIAECCKRRSDRTSPSSSTTSSSPLRVRNGSS